MPSSSNRHKNQQNKPAPVAVPVPRRNAWIWPLLLVLIGLYDMRTGFVLGSTGEMLWGGAFVVGAAAVMVKLRWLADTPPAQRSPRQQRLAQLVMALGAVTVLMAVAGFCMMRGYV